MEAKLSRKGLSMDLDATLEKPLDLHITQTMLSTEKVVYLERHASAI